MSKEIWNDVPGWEGKYQVSNRGRVKSLDYNHTGKEKILKPSLRRGYPSFGVRVSGKKVMLAVHRVEYEAFYGPIPDGMQVNHIDEDKTNNNLDNLELTTPKGNINWGTCISRRSTHKKVPIEQYDISGKVINVWMSQEDAADSLKVHSPSHINECLKGKRTKAHGFMWRYKKEEAC